MAGENLLCELDLGSIQLDVAHLAVRTLKLLLRKHYLFGLEPTDVHDWCWDLEEFQPIYEKLVQKGFWQCPEKALEFVAENARDMLDHGIVQDVESMADWLVTMQEYTKAPEPEWQHAEDTQKPPREVARELKALAEAEIERQGGNRVTDAWAELVKDAAQMVLRMEDQREVLSIKDPLTTYCPLPEEDAENELEFGMVVSYFNERFVNHWAEQHYEDSLNNGISHCLALQFEPETLDTVVWQLEAMAAGTGLLARACDIANIKGDILS